MPTVKVNAKSRPYTIYIGGGILDELGQCLARHPYSNNCLIISNSLVFSLYGDRVEKSLQENGFQVYRALIPDGEEAKSLAVAHGLYDLMIKKGLDRSSPVIALGGGVVGDLAGFVASTYLRGVPYIQVPTTLLSQVDSSVGGKVAVNHPAGKNLIGSFYQPELVWADVETLATLPLRELRSGMAEVVKYGVIWDEDFFSFLESIGMTLTANQTKSLETIVQRSCTIKGEVVSQDEKEVGLRSILNFGHTFGHALETITGYRVYRHGEAVALGMIAATKLSIELGRCASESVLARLEALLSSFGLATEWPADLDPEQLIKIILHDKKKKSGQLHFVLVCKLGKVALEQVDIPTVRQFLLRGIS
ncbi:MAG: 3-dehydroquinate synthase [Bacillota bacterium]